MWCRGPCVPMAGPSGCCGLRAAWSVLCGGGALSQGGGHHPSIRALMPSRGLCLTQPRGCWENYLHKFSWGSWGLGKLNTCAHHICSHTTHSHAHTCPHTHVCTEHVHTLVHVVPTYAHTFTHIHRHTFTHVLTQLCDIVPKSPCL